MRMTPKEPKLDTFAPREMDRDRMALEKMKEIERSMLRRLVSVRIDERTIITTTKNRIKQLIKDHTQK